MVFSHISLRERPRERMHRLGPRALSLTELLTLVVGTGSGRRSAAELAAAILERGTPVGGEPVSCHASLSRDRALSAERLTAVPGVGPALACRVAAAVELGRRIATWEAEATTPRIRGPEDVFRRMAPLLAGQVQEEFHALHLDTQHGVIRDVLVTRGILDASLIHPREVFRPALEVSAAAVILVHNHPSGDPTPSAEDIRVTRQLHEAGRILGVPVLDHVVIGQGRWSSVPSQRV